MMTPNRPFLDQLQQHFTQPRNEFFLDFFESTGIFEIPLFAIFRILREIMDFLPDSQQICNF